MQATAAGPDALNLVDSLRASGRSCLESRPGGMSHRGKISIREFIRHHRLHMTFAGNRLSAHVDRFSPLGRAGTWSPRCSLVTVPPPRLPRRNVLCRPLARRGGCRRIDLHCERVEVSVSDREDVRATG